MPKYNDEKILYFAKTKADAGLHLGIRDMPKSGTELAGSVNNMLKKGFLSLNKGKSNRHDRYFNITPLGDMALMIYQLKFKLKYDRDDEANVLINKIGKLFNSGRLPEDFTSKFSEILNQSVSGEFDVEQMSKSDKRLKFMNRFNLIEPIHNQSTTLRKITPVGSILLDAIAPDSPKNEIPPTATKISEQEHLDTQAPKSFDDNMNLFEYTELGNKIAKQHLSQGAFEGFNQLHWDGAYIEEKPLYDAILELTNNQHVLERNAPSYQAELHKKVSSILKNINTEYGGDLEKPQITIMLQDRVKEELGLALDDARANHYVVGLQSNPFINDNVAVEQAVFSNTQNEQTEHTNRPKI